MLILSTAFLPANVYADVTINLSPTDDTFIDTLAPSSVQGANNQLNVCNTLDEDSNQEYCMSFIKFDLASIHPTATISEATLSLYVHDNLGLDTTVYIGTALDPWSESTLIMSGMPSYYTGDSVDIPGTAESSYFDFDVTSDVQNFALGYSNGGTDNYGWILSMSETDDATIIFASKEASGSPVPNMPPVLTVTYSGMTVVPEYAYGALIALVTCFAGFAAFKKLPRIMHRKL